jgi:RNA-directed DNA polymerase
LGGKGPWQERCGFRKNRDRVVQAAGLLILEPIFESDFLECSHGFRPQQSAHDALVVIRENLAQGRCTVIYADMASYFDSISHDKLMACVWMCAMDGSVLRLIKQWLDAAVEDRDGNCKIQRRRNKQGAPQRCVISPLLANIYLHWFDHVFHAKNGSAQSARAVLLRYAEGFVIMAHYVWPALQRFVNETIEGWLGLKMNWQKTRIINLPRRFSRSLAIDFFEGYIFQ